MEVQKTKRLAANDEEGCATQEGVSVFLLASIEHVSHDTIDCLKSGLEEAENGQLIGAVLVSMYKHREWGYRSCGEAHLNPMWSVGMLQAVSAKLANGIIEE